MQTAAIMHDCVVRLLNHQDEESVQCLCSLLTTMGKVLDLEEAKPQMDEYFNQIEKIVKEGKTSSGIRLMLQDIIDLRLHNWVSRGPEQGTITIDEQEEPRKVEKQVLSNETERQPGTIEGRTTPGKSQRSPRTTGCPEDPSRGPITTVPKEAKITEKEEPRKVQPQMKNIQQGPWAQVPLVKGSGGGAKAGDSALQSSPSPQPSTPPQEKADFDGRRGNKNRNRRNRLHNLLHNAPAFSQPDPLTRGTCLKELLESPAPEDEWATYSKKSEGLGYLHRHAPRPWSGPFDSAPPLRRSGRGAWRRSEGQLAGQGYMLITTALHSACATLSALPPQDAARAPLSVLCVHLRDADRQARRVPLGKSGSCPGPRPPGGLVGLQLARTAPACTHQLLTISALAGRGVIASSSLSLQCYPVILLTCFSFLLKNSRSHQHPLVLPSCFSSALKNPGAISTPSIHLVPR
ncbi:unnamed protein product [Pleuronectes platessa]|uniref:MIF4G domain-containing protein n=1 Tax=Pleuronectes platessa TaxID=8262 RepID=A0A9N7YGW7_PLEPL|nr:unnamed protein product [Pleuronectes platessa]